MSTGYLLYYESQTSSSQLSSPLLSAGLVEAGTRLAGRVGCERGGATLSLVTSAVSHTHQQVALHRAVRGEMTVEQVGGSWLCLIEWLKSNLRE